MKFRFVKIFILSFILLTPLAASATQCCWSEGQVSMGPGGAGLSPDSCAVKTTVCPEGKTEVDCSTKDRCKALMPICCIFRYTDPTKKNFCYESADQSYDCSKSQPNGTSPSKQTSHCADLPDCTGAQGDTLAPATPTATSAPAG